MLFILERFLGGVSQVILLGMMGGGLLLVGGVMTFSIILFNVIVSLFMFSKFLRTELVSIAPLFMVPLWFMNGGICLLAYKRLETPLGLLGSSCEISIVWLILMNDWGNLLDYRKLNPFDIVWNGVAFNLHDIPYNGHFFTWTNKQAGSRRVMSKINRVLGNDLWDKAFPTASTTFLPEGLFDHSPMLVTFFVTQRGKKPFRFLRL